MMQTYVECAERVQTILKSR